MHAACQTTMIPRKWNPLALSTHTLSSLATNNVRERSETCVVEVEFKNRCHMPANVFYRVVPSTTDGVAQRLHLLVLVPRFARKLRCQANPMKQGQEDDE